MPGNLEEGTTPRGPENSAGEGLAAGGWRNLLDVVRLKPDDEAALRSILQIVRAAPLKPERLEHLRTLASDKGSIAHRFLLIEALHHQGLITEAEEELRSAWRDRSNRPALTDLGKRHPPRIQERRRFYDCQTICDFRGKHVLEVGGQLPRSFVEVARPASWTALDLNVPADDSDLFYKAIQANAADMPLPDSSVSLIFSSSAFEHIADLGGALREMHRVLRPHGLVYSEFSPIWSAADGHLLRGAVRKTLQDAGLWPLPPWAHLTMTRGEMRSFLAAALRAKELRTVERWLYRRDSLNRLFYEDYNYLFHNSPLSVLRLDFGSGPPPDEKILRLLHKRQPGRSNFHVRRIKVILSKPAPASSKAPTEKLSESETAAVQELIQRHLGTEPLSAVKIAQASGRRVFLVRLAKRRVVLKVLDSRVSRAVSCSFAVERLAEVGVPTPATLAFGTDGGAFQNPFLIQEYAPGIPADRWILELKPTREEVATVLANLGSLLRKIHSVATAGGWGSLDDQGRGFFRSWPKYLYHHKSDSEAKVFEMAFLRRSGLLSEEEIDQIRELFQSRELDFKRLEPRLLHNDVTLKNVLVDPRSLEITAILDLHNALAGDPPFELARFYYFNRGRGYYRPLLEGYGDLEPDSLRRVRLYLVYVLLEKLEWLKDKRTRFPGRLERDLDTLRHTLGQFGRRESWRSG